MAKKQPDKELVIDKRPFSNFASNYQLSMNDLKKKPSYEDLNDVNTIFKDFLITDENVFNHDFKSIAELQLWKNSIIKKKLNRGKE